MNTKLIALLFFTTTFCFSQQKQDINLEAISTTKGVFTFPSWGIHFSSKTKLKVGILIGQEFSNLSTAFGGQTDFLYFPNEKKHKQFNLFFIASYHYFYDKVSLNFSKVTSNTFQTTLGYGFTYSISNKLTLQSQMSVGGLIVFRSFNFNTTDPSISKNFAGNISIGLAYKL